MQSGKTKGKAQGAPGLMPVRVLQGKLLDPSMVFMLRKVTSSDLLKVSCWKCSFTLLTSNSPLFSKLEEIFFKVPDQPWINIINPSFIAPEQFLKIIPDEFTLTIHELLAESDGGKENGVVVSRGDLVPGLPLQVLSQGQPGLVAEDSQEQDDEHILHERFWLHFRVSQIYFFQSNVVKIPLAEESMTFISLSPTNTKQWQCRAV